jgi:tRNA(Ile)-lysidine synthase
MKATEQKVLSFIKENELLLVGEKILVALSGGPDSVFLLHFLNKFKRKFKVEIGAAHINHKLRGSDSERDELFCNAICDELSIPFYVLRTDVKSYSKKNKLSIELAARKIRYDFFAKISNQNNYNKIVTAHNADDNVETVLLNLVKGAGIKGISGIPIKRDNIIRPILSLPKKEILDYLEENKFEYRIDQSNLSNDFERNFLRNKVVPLLKENLNPSLTKAILNTSINLQNLILGLDDYSEKIKLNLVSKKNKSLIIPIETLKINDFVVSFLIKNKIDENFSVKLESNDLKKIISLVKKQAGISEELTENLIALKERNEIIIKQKSSSEKVETYLLNVGDEVKIEKKIFSITDIKAKGIKLDKSKNVELISAENINKNFVVRAWQNGDKFFPIGMKGSKKISDYLNDIKINSFEKKNQLVLLNDKKIVWVIGKRLDERFKINSNTKKVLMLCLK